MQKTRFTLKEKMIRQLKSIRQIEVLLLSDLERSKELQKISPKIALTVPSTPDECNWEVVEWNGSAAQIAKVNQHLSSKVADLKLRYKAISPRAPEQVRGCG